MADAERDQQPPQERPATDEGSREEDVVADADAAPGTDAGVDAQESGDGRALEALAEADPRDRVELLAELVEAEARRDEYLEDLRRARAEFENYRKRVMREGAAQREAGKADAIAAMLEVLDDFDRTLDAAEHSDDARLAKGVELVAGKLVQALQGLGLERVDAVAIPFDPTVHEAVQHREAGQAREGPTVAEVLRPGYRLGDRVLRAAMVVVEE